MEKLEPKFKAGDIVQHKLSKQRIFIVESLEQTCVAGIGQIQYHCRIAVCDGYSLRKANCHIIAERLYNIGEVEFEEVSEESEPEKK